jgi:hypothetical protein
VHANPLAGADGAHNGAFADEDENAAGHAESSLTRFTHEACPRAHRVVLTAVRCGRYTASASTWAAHGAAPNVSGDRVHRCVHALCLCRHDSTLGTASIVANVEAVAVCARVRVCVWVSL